VEPNLEDDTDVKVIITGFFFARDFVIAIFGYVFELNIGLRLLHNHCMD